MDEPRQLSTIAPLIVPEIVEFPAEVDIDNVKDVEAGLAAALQSAPRVLIADMSITDYCDSSGIRCLLEASDRAARSGGELRVVIRSAAVRRIMQVIGVDQVLRLYPELRAALTGIQETTG